MAQTATRKRTSTTRRGSAGSRNGSSKTSKARNRNTSAKSRNGSSKASKSAVAELAAKAKPQAEKVKRTGDMVSQVAAKVKTPLIAGGAALAGLAGGVALKSRTENRRPVEKLRMRALPKAFRSLDLGKVDLKQLAEMGRKVRSIGEQVGDVADAADKTRKKHN